MGRAAALWTRITLLVFLLNSLFWALLWIDIGMRLEPYRHRPLRFEEVLPEYIFWATRFRFRMTMSRRLCP